MSRAATDGHGKDYFQGGAVASWTPSGRGVQVSVLGVAGVLVGLEVTLLDLTFGLGLNTLALKLPVVGRVGGP